jgi:hypothetical protein
VKKEKLSLSVWMYSKVFPAAFLVFYYWMCVRDDFQLIYRPIQSAVFGIAAVFVLFQVYYAKKKDLFDEFAKENLRRTDSICFKAALVFLVCITIICAVFVDSSRVLIGYCIVGCVLLLTVLRAVIFSFFDKRGM